MTEQQIINRAVNFANNMKNINRFLIADKVTLELYNVKTFVVDTKNLRSYYEHHETIREWRNFDVFLEQFQHRVEQLYP